MTTRRRVGFWQAVQTSAGALALVIACGSVHAEEMASDEAAAEQAIADEVVVSEGSPERRVGRVVALQGTVEAVAPSGETRTLACSDAIFEGDELRTSEGARVGVLAGEVYTTVAERSSFAVSRTADGAPSIELLNGNLRVMDVSKDGGVSFMTPGLETRDVSSDVEAFVLSGKKGSYSKVCAWKGSFRAVRLSDPRQDMETPAGVCVEETTGKPKLGSTDAVYPPLPMMRDETCRAERLARLELQVRISSPMDLAIGLPTQIDLSRQQPLRGPEQPFCDDASQVCSGPFVVTLPPPELPLP